MLTERLSPDVRINKLSIILSSNPSEVEPLADMLSPLLRAYSKDELLIYLLTDKNFLDGEPVGLKVRSSRKLYASAIYGVREECKVWYFGNDDTCTYTEIAKGDLAPWATMVMDMKSPHSVVSLGTDTTLGRSPLFDADETYVLKKLEELDSVLKGLR